MRTLPLHNNASSKRSMTCCCPMIEREMRFFEFEYLLAS
jgi:hypothetical protein